MAERGEDSCACVTLILATRLGQSVWDELAVFMIKVNGGRKSQYDLKG
jgi:hypothetical protein